jgi:hypothetical protein
VILATVLVAGLALALTKPWDWGGPGPTPRAERTRAPIVTAAPTPASTSDVLAPFVTPAPVNEGLIECLRFDAWRLLTISRATSKTIRTWTVMGAIRADGPNDPAITFARVADGAVLNVGYCAPVALLPGPAGLVTVTAWRRTEATGIAVELGPLHPAYPSGAASRALFRRPTAIRDEPFDVWPPGRYVLHLVAARPDNLDVWFGVEIVPVRG